MRLKRAFSICDVIVPRVAISFSPYLRTLRQSIEIASARKIHLKRRVAAYQFVPAAAGGVRREPDRSTDVTNETDSICVWRSDNS